MTSITVFSTQVCPKCKRLKEWLEAEGISFTQENMDTPAGMTELRINGCFALEAPVLKVGDKFIESRGIFNKQEIKKDEILSVIKKGQ